MFLNLIRMKLQLTALKAGFLGKLGRVEEALDVFEQAIRLSPEDPYIYDQKGGLLIGLVGREEETIEACEQVIRLAPHHSKGYFGKALVLCTPGHYEDALAFCEQAIRLDPEVVSSYNHKGHILLCLDRFE